MRRTKLSPKKETENFNYKFSGNFNVDGIINIIKNFNKEWLLNTARQNEVYPERRNPHLYTNTYVVQDHPLDWTFGTKSNPVVKDNNVLNSIFEIVSGLENKVVGKAARILLIKLEAGKNVTEHVDSGDYLSTVRRYHIPLITNDKVFYTVNSETINMKKGECWEINNLKPHSVLNDSNEDRVHLLIDILPEYSIKDYGISVVENFINEKDLRFFIEYIDNNCENPDLFVKRTGAAHKKGNAYRAIFPDAMPATLYKEIENKVLEYAEKFLKELEKITKNKNYFYGISITKLSKDIQLRIHQDEHNTFSKLSYSAVMYLNDNYEGGEICFLKDFSSDFDFPLYEKEMNGLEYKPDKGDLVIFKSDTWHGGTKIENGNRYSIIFWSTEQEEYQFKGFDSDNVWSPDWKESLNKNN